MDRIKNKIGEIYLYVELMVFLLGLLDNYYFHKEEPVFFAYLEEIVVGLSIIGGCFLIILLGMRLNQIISKKIFVSQCLILLLTIVLPFVFVMFIVSMLH